MKLISGIVGYDQPGEWVVGTPGAPEYTRPPAGVLGVDEWGNFYLGEPEPFPNVVMGFGGSLWVGFFTLMPNAAGVGGVESQIPRVEITQWRQVSEDVISNVDRVSASAVSSESIVGAGLWTASSGGTPVALCRARFVLGEQVSMAVTLGDVVGFLPGDLLFAIGEDNSIMDVVDVEYEQAMLSLYPNGPLWPVDKTETPGKLAASMGPEFSRVDARARQVLKEVLPTTAEATASDWVGLSGVTRGAMSESEALTAAARLIAQRKEPRPSVFQEFAESLGYTGVVVQEERDPFFCNSPCNGALRGGPWRFRWSITVDQSLPFDDVLRSFVASINPAHAEAIINIP